MSEVQTVEQITRLAPFMEDYTRKLLESAYQLSGKPVSIPGMQVAGLTPEQLQAGALAQAGIGGFQPYLTTGSNLALQGAGILQDPNAYKAYMSPYTSDVIDVVGKDMARNLATNVNQLGASAVGAGAFGGARQGALTGEVVRGAQKEFGDTAARLRESAFIQAQQDAARRAAGLGQFGSQMANLGLMGQQAGQQDIANLLGIGSLYQQQNQAVLDAARQNQLQAAYEPFQRFGFFSDILRGVPTGSSTIGMSTAPSQNPLSQIAGIAATGLGLAGQLGYRPFAKPTA